MIQRLRQNVGNDSASTFLHEISSDLRGISGPFSVNHKDKHDSPCERVFDVRITSDILEHPIFEKKITL